jgi:hypothetical protein
MNREKAYRQSVYETIGDLSPGSTVRTIPVNIPDVGIIQVPVYDSKLESDELLYVILASQTATDIGNYVLFQWLSGIDIEIYHLQQNSATFDIVDAVAEEIEQRILHSAGLAAQPGWDISCTYLNGASNLKMRSYKSEAGIEIVKTLNFNSTLIKK